MNSYYARVTYNIDDKYLFTATGRYDGSSRFGKNNQFAFFPSVGAAWRISEEDFMKHSDVISYMKIRGSYGLTGNSEIGFGLSQGQITPGQTVLGGANQATLLPNYIGNKNLKWEKTTQWDIGLDFAFAKGKVWGTFDFYNKNTTNILFQNIVIQPGPPGNYWVILPGHLLNKGVELALGANIIQGKDFSWDMTFNVARNSNKITKFVNAETGAATAIYTGQINGQGVSGTLGQIITNDQPVDAFYLKKFTGFDQNGNQQIEDNPSFAGDPNPKWLYGGSTTLKYKKLTLTINGGGSGGFLIYNNTATSVSNIAGIAQGRNIDKKFALNSAEKPGSGVKASTRFLESGNFFKLRNANISYNIGNIGGYIKNATVYVAGSNLFVITKFSGFDPEVNIDKSNAGYPSRSIEYVPYPTPRSLVVGLNFSL